MAIEPIKGFYVHDEETDTDGVAKYEFSSLENIPDYENQIALLDKNVYKDFAISPFSTVNGWKLTGDGACTSDSNSRLKKYSVTAGSFLHLKLSKDHAGVYQWQNAPSVPGSLPNNGLVGEPVNYQIDGVVQVPAGVIYLITSESTSNTTNSVSLTQDVLNTEFLNSQFIALESGNFIEGPASNYMVKQANASRLRSARPIPASGWDAIKLPDDYWMWAYCYDENFLFLGNAVHPLFGIPDWGRGGITRDWLREGTAYINIVLRSASDGDADLTGFVETVQDSIIVNPFSPALNNSTLVMGVSTAYADFKFEIHENGRVEIAGDILIYLRRGGYYQIRTTGKTFNLVGDGSVSDTLIIDADVAVLNGITNADTVDVFKIVDRQNYTLEDIPIVNRRLANIKKMFVAPPFLQFFVKSNEFNNKNLKLAQYKEEYYPYTVRNSGSGWTARVNLLHITDTHIGETVSYNNLLESIDVGNDLYAGGFIRAVINTGDNTNGGGSSLSNFLAQYTKNTTAISTSTAPYLMQLGNHDANNGQDVAIADVPTNNDLFPPFDFIFSQTGVQAGDATNKKRYYYYDVTQGGHGVRIIMLDMLDHPDYTENGTNYHCQWNAVYSQAQIDWLASVLNSTPANYGVIIGNHFPFAPSRNGYSEEYPALNDGYFVQSATGNASGGWKMIPEIVDAWQRRTTISKTYNDTVGEQDIVANYNFSSANAGAFFVCYLVGHTHSKNVYRVEEENGASFNQLMMCEDSSGQNGVALNRVYKHFGTISDNAFSCLAIDFDEMKIYRTSYGVYKKCSDPTVQQTQVFSYDFSNE